MRKMLAPLSSRLSVPAIKYSTSIKVRVRVFLPFCSRVRVSHRKFSSKMSTSNDSISLPSETGNIVGETQKSDVLVQYVVLRKDLIDSWPLGSIVTQGCHASVSAIWSHKDDTHTVDYCSPENIDSMHKVTLEVKGEPQILNLSQKLTANGIAHKLWIEQPENIPTCLATKPHPKSTISSFFKNLKLCMANDQVCRKRMDDEESKNVEEVGKVTFNPNSEPPVGSDVGTSVMEFKKRKHIEASLTLQMIKQRLDKASILLGASRRHLEKTVVTWRSIRVCGRNPKNHWEN